MRPDMAKVIVERPRLNPRGWSKPKGYQRKLHQLSRDAAPCQESMKARWGGGTKCFNEHLGPLRRYLDSQVGRAWDEVFSEICAHINRDSVVQDHVSDHVEDYVTTRVILIDGVPCSGKGDWSYGRPLRASRRRWYVCPRTGKLRRIEAARRVPRIKKPTLPFVRVSDTLQCRYLDDGWHLVTLRPLPEQDAARGRCQEVDVLLGKRVSALTAAEARQQYGAAVYVVGRRRLARRELRDYPIPRDWWEGPR